MTALEKQLTTGAAARTSLEVMRELFGPLYAQGFAIELWDGARVAASGGSERFVFRVNDPGALRTALAFPFDLSAGQAFVAGLISIDGDLEYAVDVLMRATGGLAPLRSLRLLRLLRTLPKSALPAFRSAELRGRMHSRERDRAAIGFHYDQPLEFYRAFLDSGLVYSCAYYDDGIEDLDAAQTAKIDYILRKVRLAPGERLLDIGCGWGSLILRAAERFGARALGVTLSRSQYEVAQRRIAAAGFEERATVELRDYRDLEPETFDKVVSVGMFEHVGRSHLREYFQSAFDALAPGGLFLNHGIAHQDAKTSGKVTGFIERFVFPDGELVGVSDALRVAENVGFEIRDVENLREHYVRTLRDWRANLERNRDAAVAAAGLQSYRAWMLYLAGSAQGFRTGRLGLFQSLLARPDEAGTVPVPPTRRDLYSFAG